MGRAIVRGAMDKGVLVPGDVVVAEPDEPKRDALSDQCGVVRSASEALVEVSPQGAVLLAVKPQVFGDVVQEIQRHGGVGGRLVISIMAGVTIEAMSRALGTARIVRVMPNLPASVSRGVAALAPGGGSTSADLVMVRALFNAVGQVMELDEELFDAFTAVAGSGPAYVFLLAEAMERAACEMGIEAGIARMVVHDTIAGAAELFAQGSASPRALRESVTSKKGTTAAALNVLDEANVPEAIFKAIVAARDRGRELGQGFSPPAQ